MAMVDIKPLWSCSTSSAYYFEHSKDDRDVFSPKFDLFPHCRFGMKSSIIVFGMDWSFTWPANLHQLDIGSFGLLEM